MSKDNPVNTKLPSYEVHHAGAEKVLHDVGGILKDAMPPGYGFALLVFEYGEKGNLFYISSARREDMSEVLKEFVKKLEGGPPHGA